MAADFGFVANTAERHANEFSSGRPGDRFADRCFAGTGRSNERQNGAGPARVAQTALSSELAHSKIFSDPAFDIVEPGMIFVEHLTRVFRVKTLLRALRPRHGEQPIEVGPNHGGFRVLIAHAFEARELVFGLFLNGLGHLRLGNLLPVFLNN